MNNDGWGQQGVGTSDMRQGGNDLQHSIQKTNSGGPMKEQSHEHLKHLIAEEKTRHQHAVAHHAHHMERHHSRHHDSQYGHDEHHHEYAEKHEM